MAFFANRYDEQFYRDFLARAEQQIKQLMPPENILYSSCERAHGIFVEQEQSHHQVSQVHALDASFLCRHAVTWVEKKQIDKLTKH